MLMIWYDLLPSLGSVRREAVISRWDSRTRLLAFLCRRRTYVCVPVRVCMFWTNEYDLLLDVIGFGVCACVKSVCRGDVLVDREGSWIWAPRCDTCGHAGIRRSSSGDSPKTHRTLGRGRIMKVCMGLSSRMCCRARTPRSEIQLDVKLKPWGRSRRDEAAASNGPPPRDGPSRHRARTSGGLEFGGSFGIALVELN